ncbi:cysteine desulfurase family protein [Capnocytophaga catalasegens]|uniref:cysteine desulfurase n=1 Tax=Capnocytophaga catalasegens TaxID=1004260 RepID=A0AAV5AXS6_9FLAO|nr:cysteine desulfurase family protein [Capnocytophaga catalasegens]GIZ15567.1 cysteine desulfurase [Capnocytophaga catalasegens]GJM50166.1 cysteine desulfurase [Capnocytophaga catalasegens]GJM52071.1 cysteine desulfurase [Capnocytophaga catalasegens]
MSLQKIYLDNASTTPLRSEVIKKIKESFQYAGNPSSTHSFGRATKAIIEKARKNIAKELAVSPAEIIFTSGGTEANNMILRGAIRNLGITQIVTSLIEHPSVLHTVQSLENEYGTMVSYVKLMPDGSVDLYHLKKLLSDFPSKEKILVSLMHINNEIGNILPLEEVAVLCQKYNAYFHSDMVQSIGHFQVNLSEIKIDFITASAHKFYGPKGVGFAFIRKDINISPLIFGGEQERGMRAGTEPLHNIVGLEQAFMISYQNLDKEREYIVQLKKYFVEEIVKYIPNVVFNGATEDVSYNIINIRLQTDPQKADIVLLYLDMKGIACSKGSACQSGSNQVSHVLKAFLSENHLKMTNLRFSFSIFNTKEEIDYTIQVLKEFVES